MSEIDKETNVEILPHNYDGIQELDNPLPGWWLATFYITIVFAIGYYGYYEMFDGPSSDQYLAKKLDSFEKAKAVADSKVEESTPVSFEELKANAAMMAKAKDHFVGKCAACHGQLGEGIIGPNLTDAFWISSKGDMEGILVAIREGFLDKGMPPWKDSIPKEDQPYLAAYVMTLKGTNPPNAKAPQGEEIK